MKRISFTSSVLILLLCSAGFAQTPVADGSLQRLEREIARLAKSSGGTLGVTAIHIETGRRVSLNGGERFPMASTYKVAIAIQLLTRVDQGQVRLDQMVELKSSDLRPSGDGTLAALMNKPGLALSVHNLLELLLLIGDNTATDVLLRLSGGPEAVTARIRALGINGLDVSRPIINVLADSVGITLPPESEWTPERLDKLYESTTPETRAAARNKWEADARDTSTPDAMAALMVRIHRKDLLKPASAEMLLDLLRRNRDGDTRLKAMLPPGTAVAHKMGTIGRTTNDVGIITLPEAAGHIAIAAFVKSSDKEVPERERAIAQIARAAHDFFLFQQPTSHMVIR